ncbi:hypothetical protein CEXT_774111 [Caerostris extrusa]|uniref:Uncharacterized protein n=1 Tax=Caerostris extrusa TaxID=172846 RepID=A0AAV4NGE8_CAEEX|nr:hypothetical protein CEXT_774111 [Caerostris extrusa]
MLSDECIAPWLHGLPPWMECPKAFRYATTGNPNQKLQLEGNVPEMCFLVITNLHFFTMLSGECIAHGYTAFLPWMECPKAFRYATTQYSNRESSKMMQFVPALVTPRTILLMWL